MLPLGYYQRCSFMGGDMYDNPLGSSYMKKANMVRVGLCVLLASSSLVFVGCSKREKKTALGAVIGGGLGAGIGGVAGGGSGAAIGGGLGALTGGLIGHSTGKDKSKK